MKIDILTRQMRRVETKIPRVAEASSWSGTMGTGGGEEIIQCTAECEKVGRAEKRLTKRVR